MELMDLAAERVKILYEGKWDREQVETKEDTAFKPIISEKMVEIAKKRFNERRAKNPKLFDGDAYHLNLKHSTIKLKRIILAVGSMKYSLYDIARKEFVKEYGWNSLPTGMGVNAIVTTSDSKIAMADRSGFGVDHQAKISVAVGGVYGEGHPFDHIMKELSEELAIERKEVKRLILIGISNRLDERQNHELTFFIVTSLSAAQVIEREKKVGKKEGKIFFLNQSPLELRDYLKENHPRILSTGFAGLVLAGRYLWGKKWSRIAR